VLAACGLPRSGPHKSEILAGSVDKQGDAFVVDVDSRVTRATSVIPAMDFPAGFTSAAPVVADIINPGDTLTLNIYENVQDQPLLGTQISALTELQVDDTGHIFVPYAGRIRASGKSPDQLRRDITKALDTQTPDPQVMVGRLPGDGSTVTVSGSGVTHGVFPIERPSRNLSGMIAKAGGVTLEMDVAQVRVTRGNMSHKIWLRDLYQNPRLDIALRPGDHIIIEEDTRSFVALGATGTQNKVPFESQSLSAIEAIAQVGGLNTSLADPTGVFIFRNEPAVLANRVLGRDDLQGDQRMIYLLDLTRPMGMFNARDFVVRGGDTLYVTEAPYVQWSKMLSAITGSVYAVEGIGNIGSN